MMAVLDIKPQPAAAFRAARRENGLVRDFFMTVKSPKGVVKAEREWMSKTQNIELSFGPPMHLIAEVIRNDHETCPFST